MTPPIDEVYGLLRKTQIPDAIKSHASSVKTFVSNVLRSVLNGEPADEEFAE
jgi:hypothetical protein